MNAFTTHHLRFRAHVRTPLRLHEGEREPEGNSRSGLRAQPRHKWATAEAWDTVHEGGRTGRTCP